MMTSPSPSEFLTFMRAVARPTSSCLRSRFATGPSAHASIARRTFATAPTKQSEGYPNAKKHATDKKDKLDVQSANSAEGRESKSSGRGGTATEQRDATQSTDKAKKEHPEAPDIVIGMQDERGKKGH